MNDRWTVKSPVQPCVLPHPLRTVFLLPPPPESAALPAPAVPPLLTPTGRSQTARGLWLNQRISSLGDSCGSKYSISPPPTAHMCVLGAQRASPRICHLLTEAQSPASWGDLPASPSSGPS